MYTFTVPGIIPVTGPVRPIARRNILQEQTNMQSPSGVAGDYRISIHPINTNHLNTIYRVGDLSPALVIKHSREKDNWSPTQRS